MKKLAEDNRVTVLWIPGHSGIKGNETADRLAKLATKKQNPSGLEPVIGISNRSATEDIKKCLAEKHQEEWYKATACKLSKALMGEYLNFVDYVGKTMKLPPIYSAIVQQRWVYFGDHALHLWKIPQKS